uniref:Uncharacterized protein n=1 Tax=Opuntia streptacantha TaxID=393608 RepID=A0A7C9DP76_OPUST
MQLHRLACHPLWGRHRPTPCHHHWLRSPPQQHHRHHNPALVVGQGVGPDPMLHGPRRELLVRHGGLRNGDGPVLRVGRRPTCHPGRVHPERGRWARLLRRQLGRRVQPSPLDTARGRVRVG